MRQFDFQSPLLDSARRRDLGTTRSEPAIIGFAAFSLLGAIAMSYYCQMGLDEMSGKSKMSADVPVYNAKAVPRDDVHMLLGAGRVASRKSEVSSSEETDRSSDNEKARTAETEPSRRRQLPAVGEREPLYSFPEIDAMQRAAARGSAIALASNVASQSGFANIQAPDAAFGAVAPVPEPTVWSFAGLFALLLCAGERFRRRAARRS